MWAPSSAEKQPPKTSQSSEQAKSKLTKTASSPSNSPTKKKGLLESRWATAASDKADSPVNAHPKDDDTEEDEKAARLFGARLSGAVPAGPASTLKKKSSFHSNGHNLHHQQQHHEPEHIKNDENKDTRLKSPRKKDASLRGNADHTQGSLRGSLREPAAPQPSKWAEERERNRAKKISSEKNLEWNNTLSNGSHGGRDDLEVRTGRSWNNHNDRDSSRTPTSPRGGRTGRSNRDDHTSSPSWGRSKYSGHGRDENVSSSPRNGGAGSWDSPKSSSTARPADNNKKVDDSKKEEKVAAELAEEEQRASKSLLELMSKKIEHFNWADDE